MNKAWLLFCMIFAGAIWGIIPSLAKMATLGGAHPLGTTFWQSLGGGLLLLLVSTMRQKPLYLSRNHLKFYTVCGILGTTVPTTFILWISAHITAGLIAIIIALTPICTYAIMLSLDREILVPSRILGILLGFAAVCLIVFPEAQWELGTLTAWILIAFAVPLSYSIENVVISIRRPTTGDDVSLVAGMLLASSVLLLPIVLITNTVQPMALPWEETEWAIAGLITFNTVSYVIFLYLVRVAGPVYAAQIGYWSMLLGVCWGILIWDETHSFFIWIAVILMLAGMFLVKEMAPVRDN